MPASAISVADLFIARHLLDISGNNPTLSQACLEARRVVVFRSRISCRCVNIIIARSRASNITKSKRTRSLSWTRSTYAIVAINTAAVCYHRGARALAPLPEIHTESTWLLLQFAESFRHCRWWSFVLLSIFASAALSC